MRSCRLGAAIAAVIALGQASGAAADAELVAMLQDQIKRCWNIPADANVRTAPLTLTVKLKRDGSLDGEPQAEWDPKIRQYYRPLLASATRAVIRCAPYDLPAAKYDAWKELRITFRAGE